jgi:protein-S-isoprenylcysteine O-methyltransferase Ste14
MPDLIFEIIYLLAVVVETAIRAPYRRRTQQNRVSQDLVSPRERTLVGLLFVGMLLIPLLYILTPWLDFASYTLLAWARWLGVAIIVLALYVFWRSQVDLGRNWSASLQIYAGHELVTKGIYGRIRHPMYASQWIWCLAQALLLPNWIAGFSSLIFFVPLYFLRVPEEERMMLDQFGEQYRQYKARTGRIFPRLWGN